MMQTKKYLMVILLGLPFAVLKGQTPEQAVITIYYNLTYIVDTTQTDKPAKTESVLYIGKNNSLFADYSVMLSEKRTNEFLATHPDVKILKSTYFWGAPFLFYKKTAKSEFSSVAQFQGNKYIVHEQYKFPDWKITRETKIISGYNTQKATTDYGGRSYEVWFCSQLPYQSGPWKLGGLPGLILEAYDTKKEIVFTFKSLDDTTINTFQLPQEQMITTSMQELYRAIEAFQQPFGNAERNGIGTITMSDASTNTAGSRRRVVFNNPIEKIK